MDSILDSPKRVTKEVYLVWYERLVLMDDYEGFGFTLNFTECECRKRGGSTCYKVFMEYEGSYFLVLDEYITHDGSPTSYFAQLPLLDEVWRCFRRYQQEDIKRCLMHLITAGELDCEEQPC